MRAKAKTTAPESIVGAAKRRELPGLQVKSLLGRGKCFVIMPLGLEDLNVVYEHYVRPVLEQECNLVCVRGDELLGSNIVMANIKRALVEVDLVVAELTTKNPNVFYEIGVGDAHGKPMLFMCQINEEIPFDLRHRHVLRYEYTPKGCKLMEQQLKKHIHAMLASSTRCDW